MKHTKTITILLKDLNGETFYAESVKYKDSDTFESLGNRLKKSLKLPEESSFAFNYDRSTRQALIAYTAINNSNGTIDWKMNTQEIGIATASSVVKHPTIIALYFEQPPGLGSGGIDEFETKLSLLTMIWQIISWLFRLAYSYFLPFKVLEKNMIATELS